jgi:type VI secretion system protein
MISERTLFERLDDPDPPGGRRLGLDLGRLKRSVLAHLRKMLNSRHGHAPAQPDYGIPDLNEFMFAYPESIAPMRQAIERSIEKYEPRLRNVKAAWITDPDNPLNIRFEITARLVTEDESIPVTFATQVGLASGLDVEEA